MLLIDHYDSFTYNLYQLLARYTPVTVVKSDDPRAPELAQQSDRIVLSPGPGRPDPLLPFVTTKPTLGICLGMQAIAQAYGAQIVRAPEPLHGKATPISHSGTGLFSGIDSPMSVARYHSLVASNLSLPLQIGAWGPSGEVMALRHTSLPLYGVQFHPESILTPCGEQLVRNFLAQ